LAICFTAYHGLMHIGELVVPDDAKHLSIHKLTLRRTVKITDDNNSHTFEFLLPTHKTDPLFHGSSVIIQARAAPLDPKSIFIHYLNLRDSCFPFLPLLWLRRSGLPPSCSWFISKLHLHFPPEISGHSFHSGGATRLALAGVPDDKIKMIGRWSSEAWRIYVRKNPVVLLAKVSSSSSIFDILLNDS